MDRLHGWVQMIPYADHVFAVCACGWVSEGFLTEDWAFESECERAQMERSQEALKSLIGVSA